MEFVENARYSQERQDTLAALALGSIDEPLMDLVSGFATLSHCFTLQCCYGHFVWKSAKAPHTLERIPSNVVGPVTYRIAYVAFCIESSRQGRDLRQVLAQLSEAGEAFRTQQARDLFFQRLRQVLDVELSGRT